MDLIDRAALIASMGLANAVKWGNKDGYQQEHSYSTLMRYEIKREIDSQPTVDAVPVVRCKDCKQWDEEGSYMGRGWCGYQMKSTGPRYFCADGEKDGGEEDE